MKRVYLDGRMSSLLDFRSARLEALLGVGNGEKILWEMDLGLFSGLTYPLGNETEANAMRLALDHFLKTLWVEFEGYTEGLSLYRGGFDFDAPIFSGFLKFITADVPDAVPLFLHFVNTGSAPRLSPLELVRRTSRDLFPRFEIRVDDNIPPYRSFESTVGFLLPSKLDEVFEALIEQGLEPRAVSEEFLTSEWDGLDTLHVDYASLSREGMRKLKGFHAAGGEILVYNDPFAGLTLNFN